MATPIRTFRLDGETWRRFKERAEEEGSYASTLIRELITQYLSK